MTTQFKSIDQALDNAKRHGLSLGEVLEGYRNERHVDVTCDFCELPTFDTILTDKEDYLNVFCSMECRDKFADNQNEAAYEHITSAVTQ